MFICWEACSHRQYNILMFVSQTEPGRGGPKAKHRATVFGLTGSYQRAEAISAISGSGADLAGLNGRGRGHERVFVGSGFSL